MIDRQKVLRIVMVTAVRAKPEKSDDNDTSAGREYGGRALARDMLQRDRVLQGARRL